MKSGTWVGRETGGVGWQRVGADAMTTVGAVAVQQEETHLRQATDCCGNDHALVKSTEEIASRTGFFSKPRKRTCCMVSDLLVAILVRRFCSLPAAGKCVVFFTLFVCWWREVGRKFGMGWDGIEMGGAAEGTEVCCNCTRCD